MQYLLSTQLSDFRYVLWIQIFRLIQTEVQKFASFMNIWTLNKVISKCQG